MPKLLATVGLPKAGKTTLCNKKYRPMGYVIVNPDSFRLAIHGKAFVPSAEPFVWAAVYAAVDALLLAGHDVIVDATNITEKRRQPWKDRGAEFVMVDTAKETCLERALKEGNFEIASVIEKMAGEQD